MRKNVKMLIINADDFGLSKATNRGIIQSYRKGILTSTSLLATTPAFKQAVKLSKKFPSLGVGAHISLTWGKSVLGSAHTSKLADNNGYFYPSFARLFFKIVTSRKTRTQAKNEIDAQLNKIIQSGIKPDHLNSQHHIHMIPKLFPIFIELAEKYQISHIRIPRETFYLYSISPFQDNPFFNANVIKYVILRILSIGKNSKGVNFFGVLYTQHTNTEILASNIISSKVGISEILVHPSEKFNMEEESTSFNYKAQKSLQFLRDKRRQEELEALLDTRIQTLIKKNRIYLTTFRRFSKIVK